MKVLMQFIPLVVVLFCSMTTCAQEPARKTPFNEKLVQAQVEEWLTKNTVPGVAVAVARPGTPPLVVCSGLAEVENDVAVSPESVFRIGSVTKQFTAAIVMQLVEADELSLDDPITKFLEDYSTHGHTVTVRHLLNHTSGIPSYTSVRPLIDPRYRLDLKHKELLEIFQDKKLAFEPGDKFSYNNSGYYLLGMIIEEVTGRSYEKNLVTRIFEPLKLESTYYDRNTKIIKHRAEGYQSIFGGLSNDQYISMKQPFAAGAICSTVGDLVIWTQALSNGQVVKPASYKMMTEPTTLKNGKIHPYGFGLATAKMGDKHVVHHGGGINGFRSHLSYVVEDQMTIVVLANSQSAPADQLARSIGKTVMKSPGQPEP